LFFVQITYCSRDTGWGRVRPTRLPSCARRTSSTARAPRGASRSRWRRPARRSSSCATRGTSPARTPPSSASASMRRSRRWRAECGRPRRSPPARAQPPAVGRVDEARASRGSTAACRSRPSSLRYQDLAEDAAARPSPRCSPQVGLGCTSAELEGRGGAAARFDALRRSEEERGSAARTTARSASSGAGWRGRVARRARPRAGGRHRGRPRGHDEGRLGYRRPATTPDALPGALGLGAPARDELPDAPGRCRAPRPWIQVTPAFRAPALRGGARAARRRRS